MSFVASLAVLALAAAPPGTVAHVVAGTETVTVTQAGKSKPIALDLPLAVTDTLVVPVGGFVLVRVDKNGLVVRIDEDLTLRVGDIAALNVERPAGASLSQQVDALLTPAEKKSRGTERMVGWFISPTAANVPSVATLESPRAGSGPSAGGGNAKSSEEAALKKTPPSPAPPEPLKEEEDVANEMKRDEPVQRRQSSPSDVAGGQAKRVPAEKANPAPPPPTTGAPSRPGARTAPAPALVLDDATARCLAEYLGTLEPAVRARIDATLQVKVRRSGADTRVFLEGALPVPACVQSWAAAQPAVPAAWTALEVPLK